MSESKEYILFSPVSGSDPASFNSDNYRDGPMLHIVRKYKPKKVYLYITDFFQPYEQSDHRYSEMVKFVSAGSAVEVINSSENINVHRFDVFDQPFRKILTQIHDENQDAEVLLNLSSGTPEMQSALYLVAATLPFTLKPIQVDSPRRGPNGDREKPHEFDIDMVKEFLNETEDRCQDVTCQNARRTILEENIAKLVDNYDYSAARTICASRDSKAFFLPTVRYLLRAASDHLTLDEEDTDSLKVKLQNSPDSKSLAKFLWETFYEQSKVIATDEARQCYDYLLYMGSLIERRAFSDFSRALSPALTTVMQMRLRNAGYDIRRFCENGRDGIVKLRNQKIEREDSDFMAFLNDSYHSSFRDGPLSAQNMLLYMKYLNTKGIALDYENFSFLRHAEERIRNLASHEMRCISAKDISKATDSTALKILQALREEYQKALGITGLEWNGLKKLNEMIKAEIQKQPS